MTFEIRSTDSKLYNPMTINSDFEFECGKIHLKLLQARLKELQLALSDETNLEEKAKELIVAEYQECIAACVLLLKEINAFAVYFSTETHNAPANKRAFRRSEAANPRSKGEIKMFDKEYSYKNKYSPKSSPSRKRKHGVQLIWSKSSASYKKKQDVRTIWSKSRVALNIENNETNSESIEFENHPKDGKKSARAQLAQQRKQAIHQEEQPSQLLESENKCKFYCSMMPSCHGEKKSRSKRLKSLRREKYIFAFNDE